MCSNACQEAYDKEHEEYEAKVRELKKEASKTVEEKDQDRQKQAEDFDRHLPEYLRGEDRMAELNFGFARNTPDLHLLETFGVVNSTPLTWRYRALAQVLRKRHPSAKESMVVLQRLEGKDITAIYLLNQGLQEAEDTIATLKQRLDVVEKELTALRVQKQVGEQLHASVARPGIATIINDYA